MGSEVRRSAVPKPAGLFDRVDAAEPAEAARPLGREPLRPAPDRLDRKGCRDEDGDADQRAGEFPGWPAANPDRHAHEKVNHFRRRFALRARTAVATWFCGLDGMINVRLRVACASGS